MPKLAFHPHLTPCELYALSQESLLNVKAHKGPVMMAAAAPVLLEVVSGSFVWFSRIWQDVVLPVHREVRRER